METKIQFLNFKLNATNSLLINPVSGAIDVVPAKFLKGSMPAHVEEVLRKRGYFLTDEERAEKLLYLRDVYRQHSSNVPYWFYVLTTLNCNFRCPICYERSVLINSEAAPETVVKAINFVAKFQTERGLSPDKINLVLFGGEPLCVSRPLIIRQILASAVARNWRVVIVTNGSRVKKFIDLLNKYSEAISDLRITLDGPRDVHNARRPYKGGKNSFDDVVESIEILLDSGFTVKVQTILGAGNISYLDELISFIDSRGWLSRWNFQWRIEGSHDYANLDRGQDEISEGQAVRRLIQLWDERRGLVGKMKFESFKYLGHVVRSFGWLGDYKTYWGPKFCFCEPQKGFQYVIGVNGRVYHCPRVINEENFCVGTLETGLSSREIELKHTTILERNRCVSCHLNTLCGGGCVVHGHYHPSSDCQKKCLSVITEFIDLMKDRILKWADLGRIVSINDPW